MPSSRRVGEDRHCSGSIPVAPRLKQARAVPWGNQGLRSGETFNFDLTHLVFSLVLQRNSIYDTEASNA